MFIFQGRPFTWLFSTDAVCLSHMGLISIPRSLSLSPCLKNSSMILSVHCRYTAKGFVGLLRSAQCTMFLKTCTDTHNITYRNAACRCAWTSVSFSLLFPCGCPLICVLKEQTFQQLKGGSDELTPTFVFVYPCNNC